MVRSQCQVSLSADHDPQLNCIVAEGHVSLPMTTVWMYTPQPNTSIKGRDFSQAYPFRQPQFAANAAILIS
jgi:hypothetical protein